MPLIHKTFKRLHYPIDVIAQCVRWYLAYALRGQFGYRKLLYVKAVF